MPDEFGIPTIQAPPSASDLQRLRNILYGDHARRLESQLSDLAAQIRVLQRELLETIGHRASTIVEVTTSNIAEARADLIARGERQTAQLQSQIDQSDRTQADRLAAAQTTVLDAFAHAIDEVHHRLEAVERAEATQLDALRSALVDQLSRNFDAAHQQIDRSDHERADQLDRVQADLLERFDQADHERADQLDRVQADLRERLDQTDHARAVQFQELQSEVVRRFDQQFAQHQALRETLIDQVAILTTTQRDILKRLDQHNASLAETHRLMVDDFTRLTRQLDEQRQMLRATLLEHLQQHEATWLNEQHALLGAAAKIAEQLNSQARANYDELNRRIDKLNARIARQPSEPSPPAEPPALLTVNLNGQWATDIRQWRPCADQPKLADKFARFCQRAIEQLPERAQRAAWFGVHADRISLTVGNIVLASIAADRSVSLLVDKDWDQPARLTQAYTPLGWKVIGWNQVAVLNRAKKVWLKYHSAADKVWDAPAARIEIKRNLVHKRRVRTLLSTKR